jgi:hypothetical protein
MFSILNKAFGQSAARGLCFRSEFTGPDAAWRWTLGVRVMTFSFIAISSALTSFTILGMVKSWFWIPLWWLLAVCFVAIAIRLYGYCLRGLPNDYTCPECGQAYEIEEVEQRWHEWIQNLNLGG